MFRNDAGSNPYERTPAAADAALQAATKAKELISDVLRGKCTPPEKSPIGMVRMHRRHAKLGATFREFISQLGGDARTGRRATSPTTSSRPFTGAPWRF